MSKLFKLKEWLTVPDAAKHLSVLFGEEVTEADVLRLGLDRHLKLSVNFVNHAKAKRGKIITREETEWFRTYPLRETNIPIIFGMDVTPEKQQEFPPNLQSLWDEVSAEERNKSLFIMRSDRIDIDHYLNLINEIETISGVWDLPLIGAEALDIEHRYQILTSGPSVTLQNLNGCFVQTDAEEMFQLQEKFDTATYQSGSKEPINYYPAGGLPDDCVLVVRTAALREFEQKFTGTDSNTTKSSKESTRKTENLLRALAAIAIDDYGYKPESLKSSAPQDIANATSAQGVSFDAKTIRNWLKEGAALLPSKREED